MIYLELFWEFFKIGLFSVGGGLATIPFLYDIGRRYDWLDTAVIPDMIAISESTPGPIGINMATYTGYTAAGIFGALIASLAIILPSAIIVLLISGFLASFGRDKRVLNTMYGLRPASLGLITAAAFMLLKVSVITYDAFIESGNILDIINIKALVLFVCLLVIRLFFRKIHPILFIVFAGAIGIIFNF